MITDKSASSPTAGSTPMSPWKRVALLALGGLLVAFELGLIAGIAGRVLEEGSLTLRAALVLLGALVVLGGTAYALVRLWKAAEEEPVAERVRKSRRTLWLSMGIGALLGIFMAGTIGAGDAIALYSNDPVPGWVALVASAVWALVVPLITWRWLVTVDEHERDAYNFGALLAFYLYIFATPAWWLCWRGGLLPRPEAMIIFIMVMMVWSIGWLWRRYR